MSNGTASITSEQSGAKVDTSPTDLLERLDATRRRALVFESVQRLSPGSKRGKASSMWGMSIGALLDLACLHLIDDLPAARIAVLRAEELRRAKLSVKALERWLPTIRRKYQELSVEFFRTQTSRVLAFTSGGDLMQLSILFTGMVASELLAEIQLHGMAGMKATDRHVILRFGETLNDAAKAQAESRLKNLQADKLKAILDKAEGKRDADGNKTFTAEQIVDVMHKAILGEAA